MRVTKPKKQRKRLFKAPDHTRYRHFSARVSPELRTSHRIKSIPVRSGDTIQVTRGDQKGFEGKITRVERKKYRIYVEGLRREKVDGTTVSVPIHPSKVMITNLNLEDKWRKRILERKKETHRIDEKISAKTAPEVDIKKKEATEKEPKKRKRRTTKEKTPEKTRSQKRKTETIGKTAKETKKRQRKTKKRKAKAEKPES